MTPNFVRHYAIGWRCYCDMWNFISFHLSVPFGFSSWLAIPERDDVSDRDSFDNLQQDGGRDGAVRFVLRTEQHGLQHCFQYELAFLCLLEPEFNPAIPDKVHGHCSTRASPYIFLRSTKRAGV